MKIYKAWHHTGESFVCSPHGSKYYYIRLFIFIDQGNHKDRKHIKAECKECGWCCCHHCFKIKKTKA